MIELARDKELWRPCCFFHTVRNTASTNGTKLQFSTSAFPAEYVQTHAPVGMDAPDERDIKLQRASENLLSELKSRLPNFLNKKKTPRPNEHQTQIVRRRVGRRDTDSLIQLVCR